MGKGKVYPSPSPAAVGGGGEMTAEAVLMRLLPAAVLAAAAPLGAEGKEVLAYLVLASLRSSAPPTPARDGGRGEEARAHRPELACGCFGCYTAYWSRWDGSPEEDREAIHRAIEAFEEHLSRKEEEEAGGKGRRGRKKRAAAAKDKVGKDKGKGTELAVDPLPPPPVTPAVLPVPEETTKVEHAVEDAKLAEEQEEEKDAVDTAGEDGGSGGGGGDEEKRRRGWGGVLNWRGWGLWGSH
ncbi:uncharacterized protein LOC133900811 [Phragmites australis]|uniref:uncharacterized protein LOC133900811 n=1 Tax=Phragmites australis TaxID=29695 RepID=UPI002D772467|nr:uncharacterized protein LOC133900811 [Phragmites australis]